MATAPSLCVLRYFNSWNKNLRKEGLCSVLLRTSSLFGRHYCSSNFLVGAACATALRSPDLVALEYADLNLTHKVSEELGHVRIRQHVNPLSASFSLVKRANFWVKELALSNIHFLFANATISFNQLVSTYPGPLMLVSILVSEPLIPEHSGRIILHV
ncbi:trna (guanine-n(7)-)-methyltransferase [Quercus suber]|uniref:Trna (Guanine-n(7)-)-methyltransferase n=1 Tax=Quercus suber TaxID=58331 RepID=A0AAW0IG73_QUESU